MSDPTTENATAKTVNDAIKTIHNAGIAAVENLILAEVPWLRFPILKQLFEFLLGWIGGYVIKAEQNGATFAVIDMQVGNEKAAVSVALAAVIAAEKSGDPDAIRMAIKNYADAQSALVHDDGSVPLH